MPRWSIRALFVFLLLMLARQAWLATYIHPYADDFNYASVGMHTELLPRLAEERTHWNGRWASNVLMLRGPLVLGMEGGLPIYRLVPVLLILLSIGALTMLSRTVLRIGRWPALLVAVAAMVLYLHSMPALGQGIHWYTGAVTYQLGAVWLVWHVVAVIALYRNDGSMAARLTMAVVTLLLANGFNEVNAVLLVAMHAALCLWRPFARRHVPWWQWLLLILSALALWYVAAAPGNAVRGGNFPARHDPFLTLAWSCIQTGRFVLRWALDPAVVCGMLIMLAWLRTKPEVLPVLPWGRWTFTIAAVAMVWIIMVLPYWSTGLLGQHRTVNVACFLFLPLWALALIAWDREVWHRRAWVPMTREWRGGLMVLGMLVLLFLGNDGAVNADLITGRAVRYDRQMRDRYQAIGAAIAVGQEEVVVSGYYAPPRSLDPLDLREDPRHWINGGMAAYFGEPELRIVPQEASR